MTPLFDFTAIAKSVARLKNPTDRVAERNRSFDSIFKEDVERAGWTLLRLGDHLPSHGRATVIGVVLWNNLDRDILKVVAPTLGSDKSIFVFDLDDVDSAAQFQAFMPDVPLPTTTPVVANTRMEL
jgi:hypothetical protein